MYYIHYSLLKYSIYYYQPKTKWIPIFSLVFFFYILYYFLTTNKRRKKNINAYCTFYTLLDIETKRSKRYKLHHDFDWEKNYLIISTGYILLVKYMLYVPNLIIYKYLNNF